MVARTPEYHILSKRVPVDRLQLGTILSSIKTVNRLNPRSTPRIEKERIDRWHDTKFKATRDAALRGNAGVEVKVAAIDGVGGEGKFDGKRGDVDTYIFAAVDTKEFEPTLKDYSEAGQAEEIQTFLKSSRYAPVFYITGIKVGRVSVVTEEDSGPTSEVTEEDSGPTFEANRVQSLGGSLGLAVAIPSIASAGSNTSGSKSLEVSQQYRGHNDQIFAIRVRKLQFKKKRYFGVREWVDNDHNAGAELAGEDREEQEEQTPEPAFDEVEEVALSEKNLKGYKMITETDELRGQEITYVVEQDW